MLGHLTEGYLAPRLRLSLKAELKSGHLFGCLYGNDFLCKSCLKASSALYSLREQDLPASRFVWVPKALLMQNSKK